MFVTLFLRELSASIARARPIAAPPSRSARPRDARPRDKPKVDRRRRQRVLPDQPLESLAEELERLLGFFRPHQVTVLRARLGIDGPRATLDAAARLGGMTRERARQLESRFIVYFLGTPGSRGLMERIVSLRDAGGGPLFLRDLPSKDPWFRGLAPEADVLSKLVHAASGNDLHVVMTPTGAVVAPRSVTS